MEMILDGTQPTGTWSMEAVSGSIRRILCIQQYSEAGKIRSISRRYQGKPLFIPGIVI